MLPVSVCIHAVHAKPDQCHILRHRLPDIRTIRFVQSETSFSEDILYLGTPQQLRRLFLSAGSGQPAAQGVCPWFFASAPDSREAASDSVPSLLALAAQLGVNLVCSDEDIFTLYNLLDEQVQKLRREPTDTQDGPTADAAPPSRRTREEIRREFRLLLKGIVENQITDTEEIHGRCEAMGCGYGIFCSFMIMDFQNQKLLKKHGTRILTRLEELFPDALGTVYGDGIVLLLARPNRSFQPRPVFDTAALTQVLESCQAYAAISNATSRRGLMRTQYMITRQALSLARKLFPERKERIFYFEDLAQYLMIELAVSSFRELFGHDDIVLLIHPDAIRLIEYDQKHHSDLMKFVYHYCLCSCNIVQTARSAFMHRNTAASRLARVHKLITADLADGQVQQRMIFSYKVYHYYQKCSCMSLEERMERL